jgi:transcriptional regulator with XRE-family HTH domain
MKINERLAIIRNERGLKAVYVADKVGLSANMLSMIEKGRCNVTVAQLMALSKFYCVTTDYLLFGDNERLSA